MRKFVLVQDDCFDLVLSENIKDTWWEAVDTYEWDEYDDTVSICEVFSLKEEDLDSQTNYHKLLTVDLTEYRNSVHRWKTFLKTESLQPACIWNEIISIVEDQVKEALMGLSACYFMVFTAEKEYFSDEVCDLEVSNMEAAKNLQEAIDLLVRQEIQGKGMCVCRGILKTSQAPIRKRGYIAPVYPSSVAQKLVNEAMIFEDVAKESLTNSCTDDVGILVKKCEVPNIQILSELADTGFLTEIQAKGIEEEIKETVKNKVMQCFSKALELQHSV